MDNHAPKAPMGPLPGPDPVTGALSIPAFGKAYAQAIMSDKSESYALWYIDIRNFRSVNPKFGFARGNVLLRTLANNIRKYLTHELPLARLGADRFVPLTVGYDYEEAVRLFNQVIDATNDELATLNIAYRMSLSGGIYYLRPEDLREPSFQRPLDYVSIAHRNARANPRSALVQFTDEDLRRDMRRITIEQTIDEALATGQIEVWYQPQVDYIYGEIIGAEALARWNHPTLGWISPVEFIPVLENSGRVHDLDLYVWEEACRNAGRWRSISDGKPVPISVNVSRTEILEDGLMEHFLELQRKYDLPKGSLHLEVTESALMEEADRLYGVIESMRANDMTIEMDDFGSGLLSLNMLKDVRVDVVKLDIGFMRSAISEDRGGVVLGSVIRMLQGLDTPIIAEGVESLEQAELLKNMGCHFMQGFHFSRPMPLEDFESFMSSNRAVENTTRKSRKDSHLEELTSAGVASSYLFNNAIGGMIFFFAGEGTSESILVNDQFYKECGLEREQFGDAKINPIREIDPASRATMWRAAAEAREYGAALCHAKVRITSRWIDCVMRHLGTSSRGDVFSLNIVRSGDGPQEHDVLMQTAQDASWNMDLLNQIVPNGFIKCDLSESFVFDYISPQLVATSGLSDSEFVRRFHNSLMEAVFLEDRAELMEAVYSARRGDKSFSCKVRLHHGYGSSWRDSSIIGRVRADANGRQWLYALVLLSGDVHTDDELLDEQSKNRVIAFDYELVRDLLTIHAPMPGGTTTDITFDDWLKRIDSMPDIIAPASVAKIFAITRDLRHHPIAGFTDIKCNFRGGEKQRWYHVNYTCDVDENGELAVIHGYAQDANDQMGSARWWRMQAETDQLTGLLNRTATEQEINLAMHTQGSGMMFMIDLDGFKRINDELGHLTGDAVLRDVAEALRSRFRDEDVLGRYGGDEFVAFMTLSNKEAHDIAEKRAKAIIEAVTSIDVGDGTHAACSVGIAVSRDRETTFYDLLEVADEAMYRSKENGKGTYTIIDM